MKDFDKLMQEFVNTPYNSLVELAKEALTSILPVCKEIDKSSDGFLVLCQLVLAAVAADGELTVTEKLFLEDVCGFDSKTLDMILRMYDKAMPAYIDKIADKADSKVKEAIVTFVAAVSSCDSNITRGEAELIAKILA